MSSGHLVKTTMIDYMIRRLFAGLLTIWVASILSFLIIQLPPGDYVTAYIANLQSMGTVVGAEEAAALRQQYGLDQPVYVQYAKWMGMMVRGNFGVSMEYNRPVREVIGDRLPITVIVSLAAVLFIWLLALPIGIYSAVRQYSLGDYLATFVAFVGVAVPNFMLALIILYVGFKYFGMQSIGGLFSAEYQQASWSLAKVWDMIKHLPLPAIILALGGIAELIRIMRANLLDELRKPYTVTARAKGLAEHRMILKYPVRAALNPFASTVGYLFPYIVSGSIIVSLVLSLPTVGPLLYKALIAQDLFLAGTILLLLAVMTVIGTFISDLILMWIDPRIRLGRQ
ncbi:MAG TPA: ABC transporter permease [Caldilineaceae bacterium]|nr:ABC transporter permease [Caldilineaceae bacterium]